MKQPKIGLVLGGGGSRGLAHIGVLEVLVREEIPIDFIVATSMGAIVAGLFGLGYSPAEIAEGTREVLLQSNTLGIKVAGMRARQRRVQQNLEKVMEGKTFSDLNLPVTLMAVDMIHGQEIALSEGPLIPAILASSAVPGAFPPVKDNGRELADGGVIDSLATHIAYKQGADKVIAVDVYPPLEKQNPWTDPISAILGFKLPEKIFSISGADRIPTIIASMWRSTRVMTWYLHQQRLAAHPAHVLLEPDVSRFGSLDFKEIDAPIQAGVEEAESHLAELRALVTEPLNQQHFSTSSNLPPT